MFKHRVALVGFTNGIVQVVGIRTHSIVFALETQSEHVEAVTFLTRCQAVLNRASSSNSRESTISLTEILSTKSPG